MALYIPGLQDSLGLGRAANTLGDILGQRLEKQNQRSIEKQYGSILGDLFSKVESGELSETGALAKALSDGVPEAYVSKFIETRKSSNPYKAQSPFAAKSVEELASVFIDNFDMDEAEANANARLYMNLSTGGQTQFAKSLFDLRARGNAGRFGTRNTTRETGTSDSDGFVENDLQVTGENGDQVDVVEKETFQWPDFSSNFEGITPQERVKRQSEFGKVNQGEYKESTTKLKNTKGQDVRLNVLEKLNNKGNIPKDFANLVLIDKDGSLRLRPEVISVHPDVEQYIKTINDFTTQAKDSYGSRVTNFDLLQFMKRLPMLTNTEAGRRNILAQMRGLNDIDRLHAQSIVDVYDKYGVRNIDFQQAYSTSEKLIAKDLNNLTKKVLEADEASLIYEAKGNLPEGYGIYRSPEGKLVKAPKNDAEAKKQGYTPV